MLCYLDSASAHYKAVSALSFTSDGSFFVSGAEDTVVKAWNFGDILALSAAARAHSAQSNTLSGGQTHGEPQAWCEWADHALPITHIFCGAGGLNGRVLTSSLDRTCKLFDIPSKVHLSLCCLQFE